MGQVTPLKGQIPDWNPDGLASESVPRAFFSRGMVVDFYLRLQVHLQ